MSIQYRSDDCFLLSHSANINKIYANVVCSNNETNESPPIGKRKTFEINKHLFEIITSYNHVQLPPDLSAQIPDTGKENDRDLVPLTNRDKKKAAVKRRRLRNAASASASENADIREMQETVNIINNLLQLLYA